jgi:osmoprotectant transport system substrate-binding protein
MKLKHSLALFASAVVMATTLAACGDDSNSLEESGSSGDSGGGDKGTLVLGGQDFPEMQVMAAMYAQVLGDAGYDVQTKLVTTRDVYEPELAKGNVDVVPDYLAGMADFLNTTVNGEDAKPISSNDAQATLDALKPLAEQQGITMLEPSPATDQNAFIVTKEFADENNLTTLSDLAAMNKPIKLAAPADCEGRADCEGGLTDVYGLKISEIVPLDFASSQMKEAVKSGEVTLGETGTTDGSLEQEGLVLLEDDKGIQPAQNLTPAVNADFLAEHPELEDVFNKLSAALTTDDLASMNLQVDAERQKAEDVAQQFLEDKGLL